MSGTNFHSNWLRVTWLNRFNQILVINQFGNFSPKSSPEIKTTRRKRNTAIPKRFTKVNATRSPKGRQRLL